MVNSIQDAFFEARSSVDSPIDRKREQLLYQAFKDLGGIVNRAFKEVGKNWGGLVRLLEMLARGIYRTRPIVAEKVSL